MPDTYLDGLSYDDSGRLWRDTITNGDGFIFVAEDEGGVFGFASGRPRKNLSGNLDEYRGELTTAYVLPSRQGTGTGRMLVEAVARHFDAGGVNSMLLWVFAENRPARRFYESLGGVPVAQDDFELGGVRLSEVAYGWRDLAALMSPRID